MANTNAEFSSGGNGLIVLCAANTFDGIKLADQHLAENLARIRPVLYVDPPMSMLSGRRSTAAAQSLEGPRLRLIGPRLARLTPVVNPFPSRSGLRGLANVLTLRILKRATAALGGNVEALISAWPMYPVLGSCGEKVKVYWAQDDFVGGAALLGLDARALDRSERRSASAAEVIIAANPTVAETWRSRGYEPLLIPFGADTQAYRNVDDLPRPSEIRLPAPIAGFVGHINSRIDLRLLEAVAARSISILLVGPKTGSDDDARWGRLLNRPNVAWVGPKAFESLPAYMGVIDVGLVPYDGSAFNRGSFPLKTLEYLAAGRPVVSTDLPATRWLNTPFIKVAAEPEAYAEAVARSSVLPRQPEEMASRRAFAAWHDWSVRAQCFAEAISEAANRKSVTPR